MNVYWLLGLAMVLIAAGAFLLSRARSNKAGEQGSFTKRAVASANEQAMYWRLTTVFPEPEYVVLTQVSLGALLMARGGANHSSVSQKIADFVLLDRSFKVLSIIELEDANQRAREGKDAARDAMLAKAGYKILRYRNMPQPEKLLRDLAAEKQQMTKPSALE